MPSGNTAFQTRLEARRKGLYEVRGAYIDRYEFFKGRPLRVVIAPQEMQALFEHASELETGGVIVRRVNDRYVRAKKGRGTLEVEADGRRILVQSSSGAGAMKRPPFKRVAGTARLDPGSVKRVLFA